MLPFSDPCTRKDDFALTSAKIDAPLPMCLQWIGIRFDSLLWTAQVTTLH
jgi:hypothetical protein